MSDQCMLDARFSSENNRGRQGRILPVHTIPTISETLARFPCACKEFFWPRVRFTRNCYWCEQWPMRGSYHYQWGGISSVRHNTNEIAKHPFTLWHLIANAFRRTRVDVNHVLIVFLHLCLEYCSKTNRFNDVSSDLSLFGGWTIRLCHIIVVYWLWWFIALANDLSGIYW